MVRYGPLARFVAGREVTGESLTQHRELELIAKAMKQNWKMSDEQRKEAMDACCHRATNACNESIANKAFRLMLEADKQDRKHQMEMVRASIDARRSRRPSSGKQQLVNINLGGTSTDERLQAVHALCEQVQAPAEED